MYKHKRFIHIERHDMSANDIRWMRPVIERTKELVKAGLCKDASARASNGEPVQYISEHAVCWSLYGAIMRAEVDLTVDPKKHGQIAKYLCQFAGGSIVSANDAAKKTSELLKICTEGLQELEVIAKRAAAQKKEERKRASESW